MKKKLTIICSWFLLATLAAGVRVSCAQGSFEYVTGKDFDNALPKDFYLEGNAIPTQKRNAGLLKTPAGARLVFALLDTSGYSSQVQEKYLGMLISEGSVSVCGNTVSVGSFGFGIVKSGAPGDGQFVLYDQAGKKVMDCTVKSDAALEHPSPLQVKMATGKVLLYLGRYLVELKP